MLFDRTFKRIAFLVPVLTLAVITGFNSQLIAAEPDELFEQHKFEGMAYRLMKPIRFDANAKKKYPLILSLHGAGGRKNELRGPMRPWTNQLAEKEMRERYPSYVLAPHSGELWSADRLGKIKKVIGSLPAVDMNRIYILGHSMGGHGTFIYIQLDPNYFAAAAPSAGTGLKRTEKFIDANKIKDVPIWTFHGDKDKTCPYDKVAELFKEMKTVNGNLKLTTYPGAGHGISTKFVPGKQDAKTTQMASDRCDPEASLMDWLFKQRRS